MTEVHIVGDDDQAPIDPTLDTSWMADAECKGVDTELFYPERGDDIRAARAVCAVCPVAGECLEYALAINEKVGVWGGMSSKERRQIRKERGAAKRPEEHGTRVGYYRHQRAGSEPCDPCREAYNAYKRALYLRDGAA